MTAIAVAKMHGAGNDFIVLDVRKSPLPRAHDFARAFCARHTGIGADGVLAIEDAEGLPYMRVINADGSEAEMCGNGIRCVAAYLDRAGETVDAIESAAGRIGVSIERRDGGHQVTIELPVHGLERFAHNGADGAFVDMGNPHVVLPAQPESDIVALAKELNQLPRFERGTNVHLVRRSADDAIEVTHHERGAGLTLACGTGAVAAAAAEMRFSQAPSRLRVAVPGGDLIVEWNGGPSARLTGPAVHVFDTVVQWP